jgi:hypothetical protein
MTCGVGCHVRPAGGRVIAICELDVITVVA